jgi:NHL repeat
VRAFGIVPIVRRLSPFTYYLMKTLNSLLRLAAVILATASAQGQDGTVYAWRNFAGQPGGAGCSDGSCSAARFNQPWGVAVDSVGNVYVVDRLNHTIRKITGGVVTTLAGFAGSSGSADGTNNAARFYYPSCAAADNAGNLFVADTSNHTIRKVTPDGVVTTLAGSAGQSGSADGTNSTARFASPMGVAVDSAGNVYVADSGNQIIRKVTSDGVVTTLAGKALQSGTTDGTSSTARFGFPEGIAVDSTANLYVADTGNQTIRKVTSDGVVTTLAGKALQSGSTDGTNSAARFNWPIAVSVDTNGTLYVADNNNHTIRQVTSDGAVTTLAGSAAQAGTVDGAGSAARFNMPRSVALDGTGTLYVADYNDNTIREVTRAGVVTTLAGSAAQYGSADGTNSTARFWAPYGVVVDSAGTVYVADTRNAIIRKTTSAGVATTLAGTAGVTGSADGTGTAARFSSPAGLAVGSNGVVYEVDYGNNILRMITSGGVVTTIAGWAGHSGTNNGSMTGALFNGPYGVAVDYLTNIYVADTYNHTIRKTIYKYGTVWAVTTLAGSPGASGSADGTNDAARFSYPRGVAVDSSGTVYIADTSNHTIRKMTSGGAVTTLAGLAGVNGTADGVGGAARFNQPWSLAVDSAGNIYVADAWNSTVRKVTSAGEVTTIGGVAGMTSASDGIGSSATFSLPYGIAVDKLSCLYLADTGNNRISKGTPGTALTLRCSSSDIVVSWPSAAAGFLLQQNPDLGNPSGWHTCGFNISDDGTNKSITVNSPTDNMFFRLSGN